MKIDSPLIETCNVHWPVYSMKVDFCLSYNEAHAYYKQTHIERLRLLLCVSMFRRASSIDDFLQISSSRRIQPSNSSSVFHQDLWNVFHFYNLRNNYEPRECSLSEWSRNRMVTLPGFVLQMHLEILHNKLFSTFH